MKPQQDPYAALSTRLAGTRFSQIRYREQTESTNRDASALLGEPGSAGLTIVAGFQHAGAGRKGRAWLAPAGSALLFTTVLPEPLPTAALWLVPFWSATQAVDMEVTAPIGASDSAITIRNIGYARFLNGRADRRHLVIETLAGVRYYRAITASSEIDAASESLSIDSTLGMTLQPADIKSVRFLHLVRLDSDSVEIEWHTSEVAECSTMLRSLPQ